MINIKAPIVLSITSGYLGFIAPLEAMERTEKSDDLSLSEKNYISSPIKNDSVETPTTLAIQFLLSLKDKADPYVTMISPWINQKSIENDPQVQSWVAAAYRIHNKFEEQYYWLNKAVKTGDYPLRAFDCNQLAHMYEYGFGTPKSAETAGQLYLEAAKMGDFNAQFITAINYQYGFKGFKQDYEKARAWYAKNGSSLALFNIGQMYENGQGVGEPNYEKAMFYYILANDKDKKSSTIKKAIGNLYREGKGVKKDLAEADKWDPQAANLG